MVTKIMVEVKKYLKSDATAYKSRGATSEGPGGLNPSICLGASLSGPFFFLFLGVEMAHMNLFHIQNNKIFIPPAVVLSLMNLKKQYSKAASAMHKIYCALFPGMDPCSGNFLIVCPKGSIKYIEICPE